MSCGVRGPLNLRGVGLDAKSTDRAIWLHCQTQRLLLITGNRNEEGPVSLGQVIAELNEASCLPVLTIARPTRVAQWPYREDCAYRIVDVAMNLDRVLGAGRLYIP